MNLWPPIYASECEMNGSIGMEWEKGFINMFYIISGCHTEISSRHLHIWK